MLRMGPVKKHPKHRRNAKSESTESFILVRLLKECGKRKDLGAGIELHGKAAELLEKNPYVGNTLISMYAKCGSISRAQAVFDELRVPDAVAWNSLIAGYVQNGKAQEALAWFDAMHKKGPYPDDVTLISALNACSKARSLDKGRWIHDEIIVRSGLLRNIALGNALLDMYCKCGALAKAQQALDDLPHRDVVSWNTLIQGYAQHEQGHESLLCFSRMQLDGISPNPVTFIGALKACGIAGDLDKGKRIHGEIVGKGLSSSSIEIEGSDLLLIATALVDMYAKCGELSEARQVLRELPRRDVVAWNALIAGYAEQGRCDEAFDCFDAMQRDDGLIADEITFTCLLNACAVTGAIGRGMQIHRQVSEKGLLESNVRLGNASVHLYANCGFLVEARRVLEELPAEDRSIASWNALIAGYVQHERAWEAISCSARIAESEGIFPNSVTFVCMAKACGSSRASETGKRIHAAVVGQLDRSVVLCSALVDMYAKCGEWSLAERLLQELPLRNETSWNALISGYAERGLVYEALRCLEMLQRDGLSPDEVTLSCIVRACGNTGSLHKGSEMHSAISGGGLLGTNCIVLGNSLVGMYARFGMLRRAERAFADLPVHDVVSWNALIAAYVECERAGEAIECLSRMQNEGLSPDWIGFACILKACASKGAIGEGAQIHDEIAIRGLLPGNDKLANAIVDMYAKCGKLAKARELLDEIAVRNPVPWNALLAAYAQRGQVLEAMNCVEQMQEEGLAPSRVTLLCVLNACWHAGRPDEAQFYYENMLRIYGIEPDLAHQTCMVAGFACAGRFDHAMSVLNSAPCSRDASLWLTLLGACQKWGNARVGKLAFDHAIRLDRKLASPYVLMANLYAALGMLDEADRVDAMRADA